MTLNGCTVTSEPTTTPEETVENARAAEPKDINLDGKYDGNTSGGHKFKWFDDSKVIYYDGNKIYGIVPDNGELKYVRFAEDGESFVWEKLLILQKNWQKWVNACMEYFLSRLKKQ